MVLIVLKIFARETTDEFMTEKDQLPTDASVFDRCTVSLFKKRSRSCDGVYRWMEFFDLFGTHITTEIHLGRLTVWDVAFNWQAVGSLVS